MAFAVLLTGFIPAQAAEMREVTQLPRPLASTSASVDQLPSLLPSAMGLDADTTFTVRATLALPNNAGQTVRLDQMYRGVPVWSHQVVVQLSSDNRIVSIGGTAVYDITGEAPPPTPTLTAAQALQRGKQIVSGQTSRPSALTYANEENGLVYFLPIGGGALRLAYRVSFYTDLIDPSGSARPTRPVYFIDANTGTVIYSYENIQHAALGTGPGGNTKTGQYNFGTGVPPKFEVTQSGSNCTMDSTNVLSENLNHGTGGTQTPFAFTCFNNTFQTINGAFSPLNDAQSFGFALYNMYQAWYGIPPISQKLWMRVHYSSNYENAFWNGSSMAFGDGFSTFFPLVGLDVAGHEISHGFTEQHSGLIYSRQSGGINEAFSDMAGEALEYYYALTYGSLFGRTMPDYLVGAEIFKASNQALRYMCNPPQDGASIDNVANYFDGLDVHYSSGIYNKTFCVLAKTVGWNAKAAFDTFVLANRSFWTPNTTFQSGALAVQQAAIALGYRCLDVVAAFLQVGITLQTSLCPASGLKATHDFTADGKSDILWRDTNSGDIAQWQMNGNSASGAVGYGTVPTSWSIVGQRDFTGDSKAGILWRDNVGNVAMWFMNGLSVSSGVVLGSVGTSWTIVGTGDLNADGKGDILWRDEAGNLAVWFMNGSSVSSSFTYGNVSTNWSVIASDDKRNIFWRDNVGNVAMWLLDSSGTSVAQSASFGQVSTFWRIAGIGDFDGNGSTDILWRDASSGDVAIWFFNGTQVTASVALGNVGLSWTIASTGDYNGDGRSDILWRDNVGNLAAWFMNGSSVLTSVGYGNVGRSWAIQSLNAE